MKCRVVFPDFLHERWALGHFVKITLAREREMGAEVGKNSPLNGTVQFRVSLWRQRKHPFPGFY
ncbi:hypothetical protein [Sulfuracidifex metallicus]|uniref:hypothetical protein n=1 Tax=Sulfuracidifex metallicus TaxID=47303 RepID=UPI0022752F46|nr:hypothetical protein [Sulfuracidifex metallicus]MCY0850057.1 hypothetical protein [Sulfuracidifex metallicus]